jgi:hypothetical protein
MTIHIYQYWDDRGVLIIRYTQTISNTFETNGKTESLRKQIKHVKNSDMEVLELKDRVSKNF